MTKVLVFVHGAGKTAPDYAVDPLAAIALLLGAEPPSVPVYYADVTRTGSLFGVAALKEKDDPPTLSEPPRMTQFKTAFATQVLSARQAAPAGHQALATAELAGNQAAAAAGLPGQDIAELISAEVNQIAGYLFNPLLYNQIQSRMYDGLNKATKMGDSIVIASHSLGTVVAFDGLRALAARYRVATFFTLGSPLGILRRLGNRSADLGAIAYDHVGTWLNFYDTTDPISTPLGPDFPLPGYRLRDVFVDVASAPLPAHDYFRNSEVLTEIAKALK
jgi:hypothetical protein